MRIAKVAGETEIPEYTVDTLDGVLLDIDRKDFQPLNYIGIDRSSGRFVWSFWVFLGGHVYLNVRPCSHDLDGRVSAPEKESA